MAKQFKSLQALSAVAVACVISLVAGAQTTESRQGQVTAFGFVGRLVANLDASVAFYKAIGFSQDPAADSAWRRDEGIERLYGVKGIETRMAKMFVDNASGGRFVVYLREVRGIQRKNRSVHAAWEAGATHFGLVVPDAQAVWSRLRAGGVLRARSWGEELIAAPGETRGMLAYMTDPDGLDIEIINERPATPAEGDRPARPALTPGVNHVGLIVLDSDKARSFYVDLLGGQLLTTDAPWLQGDFYDSAVGGHGNILRFYNASFARAEAPDSRINLELVEFQNRRNAVESRAITDIGVAYFGFEVRGLEAFLDRAQAAGAKVVSEGIVTMRTGTRQVMILDPDTGAFVQLYEHPKQ
jgi:catechol 2,3-dioxygenase-like lactoylglutathione lyase family enzyme